MSENNRNMSQLSWDKMDEAFHSVPTSGFYVLKLDSMSQCSHTESNKI